LNRNIFITGFSGTGKTSIGEIVSKKSGWDFIDTDNEIVNSTGLSISEIFEKKGEDYFRKKETEVLKNISARKFQIISTGGGILTNDTNFSIIRASGKIICLEATPDTIKKRLNKKETSKSNTPGRPLLSKKTLQQITELKKNRQHLYALANWTIHTDDLNENQVASEIVTLINKFDQQVSKKPQHKNAIDVSTDSYEYTAHIGSDIIEKSAIEYITQQSSRSKTFIVTDKNTLVHTRKLQLSLESSKIETSLFILNPGEQYKNIDTVNQIYQWLANNQAQRNDFILGIGGGVVGDITGFVAATFNRGLKYGLIPTTLLAMVDSSIGGKTGFNLKAGKNLVGSFYQPSIVIADISNLNSLPENQLASGWAEAIKYGLILDKNLFSIFQNNVTKIQSLEKNIVTKIIRRCIELKSSIVSADEKETSNQRIILNYGHTVGHAIEASTNYRDYLHGEAISIGMTVAANISAAIGLINTEIVKKQTLLLEAFNLPTKAPDLELDKIYSNMFRDKKIVNGKIQWILLQDIGKTQICDTVDENIVKKAIQLSL
tara:strand:+ start:7462 stop:9102 length:1641 start_codon:yes stop_codon:yes gene_type:complete